MAARRLSRGERYSEGAILFHWTIAALVIFNLVVGLAHVQLRALGALMGVHKSVGLTIFAVVVVRIVWRMVHPAPPDPSTPRALTLIGRVNHWLLYLIFLVMPVSGYLLSAWAGRDTPYFWLFTVPGFAKDEAAMKTAQAVHVFGQWAVYAVVLLHLAGTAWHLLIRRDGLLERMLPVQDGRGAR